MRRIIPTLIFIFFFLSSSYSQFLRGDNLQIAGISYNKLTSVSASLQEMQRVTPMVGNTVQWTDSLQGGQFTVYAKRGFTIDSALVFPHQDTNYVLVRNQNTNKEIQVEWFKRPGEHDWYNAFQRLATYASARNGTTIRLNPRVYTIDTFKAGTPIFATNIIRKDSTIADTSGAAGDSVVVTVFDTVVHVTAAYTPNDITDITWMDPQNLTIIGNGAKIDIRGNFNRSWTYTNSTGYYHFSAFNTVNPFAIAWGKNVTIEGLEIDGNDDQMTESGGVAEGVDYGMTFRGTDGITLKNCYIHHVATDGLYIEGSGPSSVNGPNGGISGHASRNANVQDVRIEYCGRQALTIGGLSVGHFLNCHFNKTADTTGMGLYRGHSPEKGLDIEPIYQFAGGSVRTDRMTSDITFDNCSFIDNQGGSASMSFPLTVKGVTFTHCTLDNSKYNRLFNVISTIGGLTFENCDINTGKGAMYLTRDNGALQSIVVRNNRIISGGSGFLSGQNAQFGAIVEGNRIIGHHDTTYKTYFPVISSGAIFRNNTIVIDSALYLGSGQVRAAQIYCQIAEGNTYISEMDTTGGRNYNILYTYPKSVTNEIYTASQAVKPYGGWDVAGSNYTGNKVGIGAIQVVNAGFGKPEIKQYWLQGVPTVNPSGTLYKEGDVIWMTRPGIAGYNLYRCITGGDFTATPPVFAPVGPVSITGAAVYHNAQVVSGSDYYIGRFVDSGGTSKVATALLPNGGVYQTKTLVSDTGIVAFKSPFTISGLSGDISINGEIYINGKGTAKFTIGARAAGNNTFSSPSLSIKGDTSLISTKVRLIKDASNFYYVSFFDTATTITDKTLITLESVTFSTATNATLLSATTAWIPMVIKSLSGYTTLVNLTNTTGINWNYVTNKPTIPAAQVNSDWNASSGVAQILNKPAIGTTINVTGNRYSYSREIAAALGSTIVTESFPIDRLTSSFAMASGSLRFSAVWLPTDTTLNGVKWYQSTSGAYTANNYNGVALYSYNSSTGVATLVASSTNDGTIWTATAGYASKAFSTPYTATKGLYFIATIYSASAATTTPAMGTCTNMGNAVVASSDFTNSGKIAATIGSQTTLPSTMTMSTMAASFIQPYVALY